MPCRIFVVENYPSFSHVLQLMLKLHTDFEVCGSAERGEDALERIHTCKPDLVIVDLSLPGMSGLELIRAVKAHQPEVRFAVLTGHDEHEYAEQAIEAGASGYILKDSPEEILDGIRRTAAGETYLSDLVR